MGRKFTYLLLVVGWSLSGSAQSTRLALPAYSDEILRCFSRMDSAIQRINSGLLFSPKWSAESWDYEPGIRDAFAEKESNEIKALKRVTGLELAGGAAYKTGKGLDAENDDFVDYNTKYQLSLKWNILGSGLYKQKGHVRKIELQNAVNLNQFLQSEITEQQHFNRDIVAAESAKRMVQLLSYRKTLLDYAARIQQDLLAVHEVQLEEVLPILESKVEVEESLQGYAQVSGFGHEDVSTESINSFLETYYGNSSSSIQLDSAAFLSGIRSSNLALTTARLQVELLEAERQLIKYGDRMNLSPYVRGQYYQRYQGNGSSRATLDVGLNLSIPLSGETKYKRRSVAAAGKVAQFEQGQLEHRLQRQGEELVRSQRTLSIRITAQYAKLQQEQNLLKKKKLGYATDHIFSFVECLLAYDAYWKELIALYELKEQTLLLLVDAQALTSGSRIDDFWSLCLPSDKLN